MSITKLPAASIARWDLHPMAFELIIPVAYLDLPATTKLVLLAFADSGDETSQLSAPGLLKLRAWSGLSKSQVLKIVADLKAGGYLEQVAAGRQGRRAEFKVFPHGVPLRATTEELRERLGDERPAGSRPCDPETPVDNVTNDPQEGRADATLDPDSRVRFDASRVRPTGPLRSYPSVSIAPAPKIDTPAAVDRDDAARRPATPRQAKRPVSDFPGAARAKALADAPTLSAKDVPCLTHPAQPTGRCADCDREALRDDDATKARAAAAKAAIKRRPKGSNPTKTLRDLEAARTLADEATEDQERTA